MFKPLSAYKVGLGHIPTHFYYFCGINFPLRINIGLWYIPMVILPEYIVFVFAFIFRVYCDTEPTLELLFESHCFSLLTLS